MSFTQCGRYLAASGRSNEILLFDVQAHTEQDLPIATVVTIGVPKFIIARTINQNIEIVAVFDDQGGMVIRVLAEEGNLVESSEIVSSEEILTCSYCETINSVVLMSGNLKDSCMRCDKHEEKLPFDFKYHFNTRRLRVEAGFFAHRI